MRTIHSHEHHCGWDRSLPPVCHVEPGTTLTLQCLDSGGGQIGPATAAADLLQLDFARLNPTTGPIAVDGAQPGDILTITLVDFAPSGWGWSAIIPGFGLLADQFRDPHLRLWSYSRSGRPALFGDKAAVPLKPFAGTLGLALAEEGLHSVVPPRRVGGNLDIRDLSAGSTLYLPVEVEGGLFSLGDTHAAQGDGEVCGTALESGMDVVVTLDLVKGQALSTPRFSTPGPVTRHLDHMGYEVTTGIGPDLMLGSKVAVSRMIELLCREHALSAEDAYMLCSVCGDLRISQIVDEPNWIVSFYFPRVVFL